MKEMINKRMDIITYNEYATDQKDNIVEVGFFENLEVAVETLILIEECPAKFGLPHLNDGQIISLFEEWTPKGTWCSEFTNTGYVVIAFKN